ncbi:MAG TPA: hypothetical protein VHN98_12520 [Acidimicrobiales bacterium]|nr:hypothetical protein [Acidimicrobiales bacterium]
MKFRLGLVLGFGAGYYLGAMAGRERYEQINRMIGRAKRSEAFDTATEKAKAAVDLTVERAKDFVDDHTGNGSAPTIETTDIGAPAPY